MYDEFLIYLCFDSIKSIFSKSIFNSFYCCISLWYSLARAAQYNIRSNI